MLCTPSKSEMGILQRVTKGKRMSTGLYNFLPSQGLSKGIHNLEIHGKGMNVLLINTQAQQTTSNASLACGLRFPIPSPTHSSLNEGPKISPKSSLSQHPNHSRNTSAHDPVSRVFQQHAPRSTASTRTTTRRTIIRPTIIRPIRQRPINNNSLRPIHIPHMNQTAILVRHTPIPNQLSQICAIVVIIASARAVLLTQTCHGESLVLVRGLGGVGCVVETVGVVVVVFVGAIEPEAGEDEETGAEEGEGGDAGGGA